MKTIETQAVVTADGQLSLQAKVDMSPGEYHALVVLEERPSSMHRQAAFKFPVRNLGKWPEKLSLRREDMYD